MKHFLGKELQRDMEYYSRFTPSENLSDEERVVTMDDLFEFCLECQKTKPPEQLDNEGKAEILLNTPNIAPKYMQALEEARLKGKGFFAAETT